MWGGDTREKSGTYKQFVRAGAPFIGGVSGSMQAIVMGLIVEEGELDDIPDGEERELERNRREKVVAVQMAALVSGGHHSISEMLYAAQSYDLFPDIVAPLENYPLAMRQLGDHFEELGFRVI